MRELLHLETKAEGEESISNMEKKILLLAVASLLAIIMTCTLFNDVLDEYFMWICLHKGLLTIYWRRKPLYVIQTHFNPKYPIWIPLIPLTAAFAILLAANMQINLRIIINGRRIHHYHIGLLLIVTAAILLTAASLININEPTTIFLCSKKTNITEILQGLSLLIMLGGAAFTLLDIKDIADELRTQISP